jgi:hypothetical protein
MTGLFCPSEQAHSIPGARSLFLSKLSRGSSQAMCKLSRQDDSEAQDQVMSHGDSAQSMSSQCALRFPTLSGAKTQITKWDSDVCRLNQAPQMP